MATHGGDEDRERGGAERGPRDGGEHFTSHGSCDAVYYCGVAGLSIGTPGQSAAVLLYLLPPFVTNTVPSLERLVKGDCG